MMWMQLTRRQTPPKTISRRLTSIRAFSRAMFGVEMLMEYRGPKTQPGQPHPIPEGMTAVDAMIECASSMQHKALIALCGRQGCRIAEALSITYENFDFDSNLLRIRGKGDVTRFVPLSDKSNEVLAEPVVASMVRGEPLVTFHERYARRIITDLGAKALVCNEGGERVHLKRRISSHDLRATFGTAVYDESGGNIRLAQMLLGHVNITTTQIYVGVGMEQLRAAVNSI